MKKQNKKYLIIGGIIILVILVAYLGGMFAITGSKTTNYKNALITKDSITYSMPTPPNGNVLYPEHIWKYVSGNNPSNLQSFDKFYQSLEFLKFYIAQGLKIDNQTNVQDFYYMAGDSNPIPFGCHLSPNYCNIPTPDKKEFINLDSDGCPHYKTYNIAKQCLCPNIKSCEGDSTWSEIQLACQGASPPCRDCSEYILAQNDVGGRIGSTPKNYKSILESDGWLWNNEYECWQKNGPTVSLMENIAKKMTCKVEGLVNFAGTSTADIQPVNIPYSFDGVVTGWEGSNGFGCRLTEQQLNSISSQPYKRVDVGEVKFTVSNVIECPTGQTMCSDNICKDSCSECPTGKSLCPDGSCEESCEDKPINFNMIIGILVLIIVLYLSYLFIKKRIGENNARK